jgi:Zn-dependent protease with chaperone function
MGRPPIIERAARERVRLRTGEIMETMYPAGPASVPAQLTAPSAAYKRHAWLAMAGLLAFVTIYFALLGWFGWTAFRLAASIVRGSADNVVLAAGASVCAAFLCVFMAKALIFTKRGGKDAEDMELKPAEQPELFAFLHRLADEAGAPRPHRVFLSPRVNAGVFYDLSLANLIVPSKKNLEIGLALVNVLNLGELKAVLAHEFGHFAQRTMAVGRWVYIAQQIAAHIIAKRDAFDDFLRGLSRFDLRVAWIGWLLSLIVWSIRSLVEIVFRVVVLAQRALSREMEYQADLVAASLTGSDALVHALHRLGAADDAWDRTLNFANREYANKRPVVDLFAIQTRIIENLRSVFADAEYGEPPVLPAQDRDRHRVFRNEMAQPPQMWSTHPANSDREHNIKRVYIACAIDPRPALSLLRDPLALKQRMSREMIATPDPLPFVPIEESLRHLQSDYADLALDRRFRGTYLGRSIVRECEQPGELYYGIPAGTDLGEHLAGLYPESHGQSLERLRELESERAVLEAMRQGHLRAPGGMLRWRGSELPAKQLPKVIEELDAELAPLRKEVREHDRRCRSVHLAAARALGGPWEEFLRGQLAVLHYADHSCANVLDANALFVNTYEVVTADRKVSSSELTRLLRSANELHGVLGELHEHAAQVKLDWRIAEKLGVNDWAEAMGAFTLPPATQDNIDPWLKAIDDWVRGTTGPLSALRNAALESLLATENEVAQRLHARASGEPEPAAFERSRFDRPAIAATTLGEEVPSDAALTQAPSDEAVAETPVVRPDTAAAAPSRYARLLPNGNRRLQTKLGWWDRFQTADGLVPALARVGAAGGIVGTVLFFGASLGMAKITVINGLAQAMKVRVDETTVEVGPLQHLTFELPGEGRHHVVTSTADGASVEEFDSDAGGTSAHFVYNIAGAAPLVEWTAVYGSRGEVPERKLGAPRWTTTSADYIFEEPPKQISTKGEGGTRTVLMGYADLSPVYQMDLVDGEERQAEIAATHARWDTGDSQHIATWLALAGKRRDFADLIAQRLRRAPAEVIALRAEQDAAQDTPAYAQVCERHRALAQKSPQSADLHYVAARCGTDDEAQTQAFYDGHARWPDNGWFALASGYSHAEHAQWTSALPLLQQAAKMPQVGEWVALEIARTQRAIGGEAAVNLGSAISSAQLERLMTIEQGTLPPDSPYSAYTSLKRGDLQSALRIAAGDPGLRGQMLRLVAASDGAPRETVAEALQLIPQEGMTDVHAWTALALATREHDDNPRLRELALQSDPREAAKIAAFFDAVKRGASSADAERALGPVTARSRGLAYSTAAIVLGERCPQAWREGAKRLLFTVERPYFA